MIFAFKLKDNNWSLGWLNKKTFKMKIEITKLGY